jgi:hypothetical protein
MTITHASRSGLSIRYPNYTSFYREYTNWQLSWIIRIPIRRIAQVDAEIDQRVYALYGLTEEEIRVVEGE